MRHFAIIKDNIVENIIIAENLENAKSVSNGLECVEYVQSSDNCAYIGFNYLNGIFERPTTVEE